MQKSQNPWFFFSLKVKNRQKGLKKPQEKEKS